MLPDGDKSREDTTVRISASRFVAFVCLVLIAWALSACQPTAAPVANTAANVNANTANANTNTSSSASTSSTTIDAKEPDQYAATVKLTFEAVGDAATAALPSISANVARSGENRSMEFSLPGGDKAIFLEKGDQHYLILPGRKQYAELNRESLGMDIRRMMTPAQIVSQAKAMPGMQLVGDDNLNGRPVTKYRYEANANTNTQAGNINTESYLIIDKETGLPVRSETASRSTSGGSVQGYKGMRLVTEMTDIKTAADATAFDVPTGFQKIEPEQVKAQVNLIFSAISAFVGQVMNQAQQPAASPTR
jgi:hypothetical protein